jgi:hypothetical protein
MIARRTAIKNDLFAGAQRAQKADAFTSPLQQIEQVANFRSLAEAGEQAPPRPAQPKSGHPPYPMEG